MNYKKILFTVLFMAAAVSLKAQEQGFALGANLFSPTGANIKVTFNESVAFTGVVSFNLNDYNNQLGLQANIIKNGDKNQFNLESGLLRSYFGGGVNLHFPEFGKSSFGLRVPVGIEYLLEGQPLEIYMDIAPSLDLSPNTGFYFGSSMGVRYYF